MALINADSSDYYVDITQRYHSSSNAVVTASVGRNGTAGIVTSPTTYFLEELTLFESVVEATTLFIGRAFKLTALPASRATIFQFMESDFTAQICLSVDNTGLLSIHQGTQVGAILATSEVALEVDKSYYIEISPFIDDTTGRVIVRLWTAATVMSTVIDFTGDTKNGGTGLLSVIGYGCDGPTPANAIPPSAIWDDGYVCDDTGSGFNTFLGNRHPVAELPRGVGFYTTWEPTPAPPNYANVDENPPNATDYNSAPIASPESAASFRSVSSSSGSPTCDLPTGVEGDVLVIVIRTSGSGESSNVIPDGSAIGAGSIFQAPGGEGIGGSFLYDPFIDPGSDSVGLWCSTVFVKFRQASEPASYTFSAQGGGALEQVDEISIVALKDVNLAIPVEHASASEAGAIAQPFGPNPPSATITFAQVDADSNNDLIVAIEMTELQVPATPAGYTNHYAGLRINISTFLKAATGGEIPPSTSLAASDTYGTCCFSVKARIQVATGDKDTHLMQNAPTNDGFVVNLLARQVSGSDHTVGAATRQGGVDDDSLGVTPTSTFHIHQFPYEATFNPEGEAGYALDAPGPIPPPSASVIFEVDADNYTGTYADGASIASIVETGQHALTLSLAHSVSGDYKAQTYDLSAPAVNNQPSIVGLTESLICAPSDRGIGYLNAGTGTGSDLFLPGAFTIVTVFNITQFEGCWANGGNIVIVGRKGSTIANFTGWQLQLDGGPDPGGQGELSFIRRNNVGSVLFNLLSGFPTINENTTYVGTVISDGTTVRLRLNGVQMSSVANATGVEPLLNNQLNFLQRGAGFGSGNADGPPQGNVPFTKIWSIELESSYLTALESALMAKYV